VFTELFPSDDEKDRHTDTQTDGRDLGSTPLRWVQTAMIYLPSFIKTGPGIQKLIGRIHRYTDCMEILKAYLNFFKIRKVGQKRRNIYSAFA
jgi:hypothetical protein